MNKKEMNKKDMNKKDMNKKDMNSNNRRLLEFENQDRMNLLENSNNKEYLYPTLNDPNFNIKIAQKKEFSDTKYDGTIYDIEKHAEILSNAEYELSPHQAFVRNFMSFQTPYNSLLLFHGLGSGKTCGAIGVCEEMRDYLKQMGISKQIIIVASPNVQDNFRLQLFDERKLKEVDGIWTMKGCLGNKLLKEINPTGMKGLKKDKIIQQVKNLINASYQFVGYLQFSNEIVRQTDLDNPNLSQETKNRNLQNIYNNSLIVIDEVHNIRIADDNENKNVAKNLMYLVNAVDNLRLLLLSATPMFNSYKEIVWLINLMNMNDRRGVVSVSDIFDKNGEFSENGKEMLIRKVTGYISYVRGENPYTFPFRVYPDKFAPNNIFKSISEYPICQINGKRIPDTRKIQKLNLFLTSIGKYQSLGYKYIVDRLRSRQSITKQTRTGKTRQMPSFKSLSSFGYTDLMNPIEALNIIFPLSKGELEQLTKSIGTFECDEEEEEEINEIAPLKGETDIVDEIDEIDEVLSEGPKMERRSVMQFKPVSENIEDTKDTKDIKKVKKVKKPNIVFNIEEEPGQKEQELQGLQPGLQELQPVQKELQELQPVQKELQVLQPVQKELQEVPKSNLHIIEDETKSHLPSVLNPVKTNIQSDLKNMNKSNSLEQSVNKGGAPSDSNSNSNSPSEKLYINPKELTGTEGLKRIMSYTDSKTPSVKGDFEYRQGMPHMFKPDQIGLYSAKIKNICESIYNSETGIVSEGIILIYSAYIDSGILPVALALEEMGFTRYGNKSKSLFKTNPTPVVDSRTMQQPINKRDFKPARYAMITGDPRISPDNDYDVKSITSDDNIFKIGANGLKLDISGEKIKVVLISQAGSEGLDFKAIRQIHILEPWYNMNRNEQIIGRGVRNFSHKDLPFFKRNVQIFLYGTILQDTNEEAADLYVYRISEIKAIKIGNVTRLLKETSVDCIINHDQTNFTNENFNEIPENRHVQQVLSTGVNLENFTIGDLPNSATCDYMDTCEYKCLIPDPSLDESMLNYDTYNEAFMLVNSDKIIQKIKILMKSRFFYKKNELFKLINFPKKYPSIQIYAALTQIINDNTEYISDKYNRTGYLVNIGEYYLFQPSEINFKNISIYDRSVPIDFKHNSIKFEINNDVVKPVIDKRGINEQIVFEEFLEGKETLNIMYENYKLVAKTNSVERGNKSWYENCGIVMRKMNIDGLPNNTLHMFLIEHIVDTLMINERINLLNFLYTNKNYEDEIEDVIFKRMILAVRTYLSSKEIPGPRNLIAMVIYDGPSSKENLKIYVLNDGTWLEAEPEDKRSLIGIINKKYKLSKPLNDYVGFIGFETNKKYMVYKVKNTKNERSTGFRCDQAGKDKVLDVLKNIEGQKQSPDDIATKKVVTKESAIELCIKQEFTLRNLQKTDKSQIWFLDTETAIYNEFEKRDKVK